MSERGAFRGRGGGRGAGSADRGGARGGGRGGAAAAAGGGHHGAGGASGERPKKENILDLTKYMGKDITVKFSGGREVVGTLIGYDQLMNLVLDETREAMFDENGDKHFRKLGLIVARGTLLVVISPVDGSEEIMNPFLQEAEEE